MGNNAQNRDKNARNQKKRLLFYVGGVKPSFSRSFQYSCLEKLEKALYQFSKSSVVPMVVKVFTTTGEFEELENEGEEEGRRDFC